MRARPLADLAEGFPNEDALIKLFYQALRLKKQLGEKLVLAGQPKITPAQLKAKTTTMALTNLTSRAAFTMSTTSGPRWVAVAEVTPKSGNDLLEGADGAYVGIAAFAESQELLRALATSFFDTLGFMLIGVEDIKLIQSSEDLAGVDVDLRNQLEELDPKQMIVCGSFHAFRLN
jgi:hypothetical protein